jgi:6-pyruvoyltetrahydropterin/6-carboxytetrahydropterin synthase
MDFGGLKEFKQWSEHMFDHTLVIAEDDPNLEVFKKLNKIKGGFNDHGVCDLRIVPGVGCEMFAKMCYDKMLDLLKNGNMRYPVNPAVRVKSVEVFEHGANSATYEG